MKKTPPPKTITPGSPLALALLDAAEDIEALEARLKVKAEPPPTDLRQAGQRIAFLERLLQKKNKK